MFRHKMDHVSDIGEALPDVNHAVASGDGGPGSVASLTQPLGVVHVEVTQSSCSTARAVAIKDHVKQLLQRHSTCYKDMKITEFDDPFLQEHVQCVAICDTEFLQQGERRAIDLCGTNVCLHVYQLHEDGPAQEELDDDEMAAANHWLLPALEFQGLWDSLIFDANIKVQLLQYATTTLLFSDRQVDSNVISWNRVILLHGPPGTGKTSLCKALAQKLSIYMSDRYAYGQLIEINSHSLFSKWFSESGKLVMKMFQKIQELIDDPEALVCVLIDEVESLTAARRSAGNEPSDAIRVVNAVLTQIDQIKKNPNVIILTTSNVTGAIDLAFVDRADIKQYIGMPSPPAIFQIYSSCIEELRRTGIISPAEQLLDLKTLELMSFVDNNATRHSLVLRDIASKSEGLSGRTLRKLPFLAHAMFIQSPTVTLADFLKALSLAVDRQFQERRDLISSAQS